MPAMVYTPQREHIIRSERQLEKAILDNMVDSNFRNGTLIIAVDSEHVSAKLTDPFVSWHDSEKFIPHVNSEQANGPFTRYTQLGFLNGAVIIINHRNFPVRSEALHHILTVAYDNVVLLFHDATADNCAYFRTYGTGGEDYAALMTRSTSHIPFLFTANYICTKTYYEEKRAQFHSLGYRPPNNRLSGHVMYSFNVNMPEITEVLEFWS